MNAATVVAGTPGGVACLACDRFFGIAPDGRIRSAVEYGFTGSVIGLSGSVAADGDGGFYALPCGPALDDTGSLVAYSADGEVRWSVAIPDCTGILAAGPEGVYLQGGEKNGSLMTAFAARDGAVRWSRTFSGLIQTHVASGIVLPVHDTNVDGIEILDPDGNTIATRTVTATPSLGVYGRIPSRDGTTLAVIGKFSGTLDLGDTTLASTTATTFIALLDIAGTTRWAYALELPEACGRDSVAPCEWLVGLAPVGDEIVVSGIGRGVHDLPASTPYPSGFLGVFGAAGMDRVVPILGPSAVEPRAIFPAPDGSIWTGISAADGVYTGYSEKMTVGSAGITIGSTTYTNASAMREDYIVNLVP